jgi:hypothetical protein
MQETAEKVTSAHPTSFILTDDGQSGGSVRRFKLERPVCSVPVVVLDIDTEDLLQMATPNDQQPIQALGADGTDPTVLHRRSRSAPALASPAPGHPPSGTRRRSFDRTSRPASEFLQNLVEEVHGRVGRRGAHTDAVHDVQVPVDVVALVEVQGVG